MAQEKKPESQMWHLINEYDLRLPKRGEIIPAEVVRLGEEGMVMDIGSKREGLVPPEEVGKLDPDFLSGIKIGSRLRVYVLQPEWGEGSMLLSVNLARVHEEWDEAERYYKNGDMYEAAVSGYNKGGGIVPFGQIRGFVPASQLAEPLGANEESRQKRLAELVGKTLALKVIEVDRDRQRLIFSERAAQREVREKRKERLLSELKEGEIRHGRVSSLSQFGAFVDLGGADGLIHLSELSYTRVGHPGELLTVGQEVEVYVLRVDRERKRIGLSLRRLQPDPWEQVADRFQVGQIVEGRITKLTDFGAFASMDDGIEGLIHSSEIGEGNNLQVGDVLPLKIISLDPERRRIGLSLKQAPKREEEPSVAEPEGPPTTESTPQASETSENPAESLADSPPEDSTDAHALDDSEHTKEGQEGPQT